MVDVARCAGAPVANGFVTKHTRTASTRRECMRVTIDLFGLLRAAIFRQFTAHDFARSLEIRVSTDISLRAI